LNIISRLAAAAACLTCIAVPALAQEARDFWQSEQRWQQQAARGWSGGDGTGWGRPAWPAERTWSDERRTVRGPAEHKFRPERRKMPTVKVSNPTFLNYTPDRLTDFALGAVCELKTATNADAGTAPAPADPAPPTFAQACAGAPNISLRMLPQVGEALARHYAAHPQFLWSDQGGVSARAQAAIAALAKSDTVGLDPADYRVALPALDGADAGARALALLRFDLALSARVLTYVLDATRGRIDPNRLSGYHDLPRKSVDLAAALGEIAQAPDVAAFLASRNPDNAPFRALVAELARERAAAPAAKDAAEKILKLRIALEQMRWLPRELGARHVFLNQPAFEVSLVDGARAPLTMRAVIGKPDSQTYFFMNRIKEVTYNPYWNVPRSIVINEMLPKLWRDPSYLSRLGYEVSNSRGRQVASNAIDWGAVATDQAAVDVRQPPGNRNALGRLKIDFPNRHAIYMHDTPQKHLFARGERAFSHGCVRLEHPREMAAALLGTSVADVDRKIASGDNRTERVAGDIPVYLAYFTAWPDAQGTVRYYKDVYRRDANLAQAIARTEAARSM
jgi:murein L,D-transpeptidase YcbB/YkuD